QFTFLTISLFVAFPSVWFPPGARPRYFMSLYPCVALLAGLAADQLWRPRNYRKCHVLWTVYARGCAIAIALGGLSILVVSLADFGVLMAQSAGAAWAYFLSSLTLAAVAWRVQTNIPARCGQMTVLAIAGYVALTHCSVGINSLQTISVDTKAAVERLKQ